MTRHPLPWSVRNGALTLRGTGGYLREGDLVEVFVDRTTAVALNQTELADLRDQLAAILDAPYRILVAGGPAEADRVLTAVIRDHLDRTHLTHARLEVAVTGGEVAPYTAALWAHDASVPVLQYPDVATALADGGNLLLLVAGAGALQTAHLAHQVGVPVQVVREETPRGT